MPLNKLFTCASRSEPGVDLNIIRITSEAVIGNDDIISQPRNLIKKLVLGQVTGCRWLGNYVVVYKVVDCSE